MVHKMIECELYPAIYKRKSFHLFRNIGDEKISVEERDEIEQAYKHFFPLCSDIKTAIRIVPVAETTCKRGEEYCILLYSEKKKHYLQNIGYIGEQLDLYLVQKNIGTLWFGIGKTEEPQYENLDFIIMIAIAKVTDETKFRKDMFKSKRKPVDKVSFYNQIDMGIYLYFLELCLLHERISFQLELKHDKGLNEEKTLYAVYQISV